MKQLTCEMCGSTDLVKQDGVFVCQACGTKYSVEEAKKMILEGKVEVTGTVKIDENDKAKNYLEIATHAASSNDWARVEEYSEKVLGIDIKNSSAWILKGRSVCEQPSLNKSRFSETLDCFQKAVDCSSDEDNTVVKREVADNIISLTPRVIQFYCNRYVTNLDCGNLINNCLTDISAKAIPILKSCNSETKSYLQQIEGQVFGSLVDVYRSRILKYKAAENSDQKPNSQDLETIIRICLESIGIYETLISVSSKDDSEKVVYYKNILKIIGVMISCRSYELFYGPMVAESGAWRVSNFVNPQLVQEYVKKAKLYEEKVKAFEPDFFFYNFSEAEDESKKADSILKNFWPSLLGYSLWAGLAGMLFFVDAGVSDLAAIFFGILFVTPCILLVRSIIKVRGAKRKLEEIQNRNKNNLY